MMRDGGSGDKDFEINGRKMTLGSKKWGVKCRKTKRQGWEPHVNDLPLEDLP